MASNVNGLPCGFCGSMVSSYRCSGCGCRFLERNFSFDPVYDRFSERKEDAQRACVGGGSFDEDDSQVHGILSMEPGWFLGIRTYDIRAKASGLNMDDPQFKNLAPTPASMPEATLADFYDARNLLGRWQLLSPDQAPRDVDGAAAMIKAAGLVIPKEVLAHEKLSGDYSFLRNAWATTAAGVKA